MMCGEHGVEARRLLHVEHGEDGQEVREVFRCDGPPEHTWEEVRVRGRLIGRRLLSMLPTKVWPEYLGPAPAASRPVVTVPAPALTRGVSGPPAPGTSPVIRIVRRR
jgi:hypothetical protein